MKLLPSVLAALGCHALVSDAADPSAHLGLEDWDLAQPMNGITFERPRAFSEPTPDRPTLRYSRLRSIRGRSHHNSAQGNDPAAFFAAEHRTRRERFAAALPAEKRFQNVTAVGAYSTQYAIQCSWDGTPVWLLFDTGSSDTWAAQAGFGCVDGAGVRHDEVACGFGRPLIQGFGQGGAIADLHFYLKYGSDETVWGPMGYSDVACGGLGVSRQQVGLANHTYWHGNNVTVGILGLAYPSLTSAYYGPVGDEREFNAVSYAPFLTRAIDEGAIAPMFSVAIAKNSSDGMLAWGGLPPISSGQTSAAKTDLIIANLISQANTAWSYSFYTIVPDGLVWGQTSNSAKYPYIVDTGTTMMYLPPPLADAVAQSFQPSAVYLYEWGAYFAPCDAIPPRFGVVVANVSFWVDPADMIYADLVDPLTGYCAIAVASGGSGPFILGDAFLQSVVAVFDVGGAQMRFYSRGAY